LPPVRCGAVWRGALSLCPLYCAILLEGRNWENFYTMNFAATLAHISDSVTHRGPWHRSTDDRKTAPSDQWGTETILAHVPTCNESKPMHARCKPCTRVASLDPCVACSGWGGRARALRAYSTRVLRALCRMLRVGRASERVRCTRVASLARVSRALCRMLRVGRASERARCTRVASLARASRALCRMLRVWGGRPARSLHARCKPCTRVASLACAL